MINKNKIRVINYNPTPLEQIRSFGFAMRMRKRLEQELNKPVSKAKLQKTYREFLEITERYDLKNKSDLKY